MPSEKHLALTLVLALACAPLSAADNPGSHQHGFAEMQLAFAGSRVEAMLMSPAGNVLGFEHHPHTPEQQNRLDEVTHWLGETPLVDTPDARCMVQGATVQHEVAGDHHHDGDSHAHSGQHADIRVTQVLICPGLGKADSLTTPLTRRFPAIEHLDIAWTGSDGQGAARLSRGENSFRLQR